MPAHKLVCPDCQRVMMVDASVEYEVVVTLDGSTPPAPCCQRAATKDHSMVGKFVTG